MKYRFIEEHSKEFEVTQLCEVLQISRSSYYSWQSRTLSDIGIQRAHLREKIIEIYHENKGRYGAPKIQRRLIQLGYEISLNTVAKILSDNELYAQKKKKFKVTTDSKHSLPVYPNILERNFTTKKTNEAWVADITYIETKEGWLYLAVILDLFSRKVVGWSMADHMRKELAIDALQMAINSRSFEKGLIHHSDRGSQYASMKYQEILKENRMLTSMSRKGNCWDNAVAESFFATLKTECCFQYGIFETRDIARLNIFEYIETYYNTKRMHSYIGYLATTQFEAM